MNTFGFNFDRALDSVIDGIEHSVVDRARTSASDLLSEEYKARPAATAAALAPADLSKLKDVAGFWRLFDIQVPGAPNTFWKSRLKGCYLQATDRSGTTQILTFSFAVSRGGRQRFRHRPT